MTPKEIIKQAKAELLGGGYTPPFTPDWSPYYWLGRLHAAKEIQKNDRLRRRHHK